MLKKILISFTLLMLFVSVLAVPQGLTSAETVAKNQIKLHKRSNHQIKDVFELKDKKGRLLNYVFELSPAGYVAVSADSDIEPVIAYSFAVNFDQTDTDMNILYKLLVADMSNRLNKLNLFDASEINRNNVRWNMYKESDPELFSRDRAVYPPEGVSATEGWVETRWNQQHPYNQYCPIEPGSNDRCVVGCVATAMAQIMVYQKVVFNDVTNIHTFNDNDDDYVSFDTDTQITINIDNDSATLDFPTWAEVNPLATTLHNHFANGGDYTTMTNEMKGILSYICGVTTKMNYTYSDGSGTQLANIRQALLNTFNYDFAVVMNNPGNNATPILNALQDDMMHARPAALGLNASGGGAGHAIVCDGYDATENKYHLNYGWAGSSDGWYSFPFSEAGLDILTNAVVNIEAGQVPNTLTLNAIMPDTESAIGTTIYLDGDVDYQATFSESELLTFPGVYSGEYVATLIKETDHGAYYKQQTVNITADASLSFFLDGFYEFTGNVQTAANITPANTSVALYKGEEIKSYGSINPDGTYSIPGVIPGDYTAKVYAAGNYYQEASITIDYDHQSFDFTPEEYAGDIGFGWATAPIDVFNFTLSNNISVGVKVNKAYFTGIEDDLLAKVRFKAPFASTDGDLTVQIWEEETLVGEKEITWAFSQGSWITTDVGMFAELKDNTDYFVGYKVNTSTRQIAFVDEGPRVVGRGFFIRTNEWNELPASGDNNVNACIEAVLISQDYAEITGQVSLDNSGTLVYNTAIIADNPNFMTHPATDGTYRMFVKPGSYTITASLKNYDGTGGSDTNDVTVAAGETLTGIDFSLEATPNADNPVAAKYTTALNGNTPNPFNPVTKISYSLDAPGNVNIDIYNVKGQKVRSLVNEHQDGGTHEIYWHGKDDSNKSVTSGIYFYRMKSGRYTSTKKMILLK